MTAVSTVWGDERGAAVEPRDKLEITSYQENPPKRNAAALRSEVRLTLYLVMETYSVTYDIPSAHVHTAWETYSCYLQDPHEHLRTELRVYRDS